MKTKDLVIVSHLRKNGREMLAKISRSSGIPISTLHDRIKTGIDGAVSKFSALLNFERMGYVARAQVLMKVQRKEKEELLCYISNHPNVNNVSKVNNGYDYLFECIFQSLVELESFLEKLEDNYSVEKKDAFYIMKCIKQEGFMADCNQLKAL